jgi:hypothetical protein
VYFERLRESVLGDRLRSAAVFDVARPIYSKYEAWTWTRGGCPAPPPSGVKHQVLRDVASRRCLSVLVETGTFRAGTVRALRNDFDRIVSVELSPELYGRARHRTRNQANAELILGDSAIVLSEVIETLDRPALFWLDAHYSGEGTALGSAVSPIVQELDTILGAEVLGHVVLIDDAREFHSPERSGYPPAEIVYSTADRHGYSVSERNDAFHLYPEQDRPPTSFK